MPAVQPYSNASIGKRIGLTHSAVCRIRMGNRKPSAERVRIIEQVYDWPAVDQFNAMRAGTYAEEFDRITKGG